VNDSWYPTNNTKDDIEDYLLWAGHKNGHGRQKEG